MNSAIRKLVLSAGVLLLFSFTHAQTYPDTVYFMNGEILMVKVIDTLMNKVTCAYQGKKEEKMMKIEEERIFKIGYGNGSTKTYYKYDTLVGNIFTVEEAWYFVLGEQDAGRNYKPRFTFWAGIVVGAAGPIFTPTLIAPVPVFVYTGAVKIPKIRVNTEGIPDRERLNHDTYLLGFERVARKKQTFYALSGGGLGVVLGFSVYYAFLQDQ